MLRIITIALALLGMSGLALGQVVFVEAEQFKELGGWVNDQQFMDQMGSPFLLAHGLGTPVKDAVTTVEFPAAGKYRMLVRTRDWVATWKAAGAPGKFQVLIEGKAVPETFGTKNDKWHWHDGGMVEIAQKSVTVALHDLTGYEGRCDAILFCADASFNPPDGGEELAKLRRKWLGLPEQPEDGGEFDFVVVGGGTAGTCAAIAGARLGLSVALVQDRPVLGGNNSSEVRVWLQGWRNLEPWDRVGDVLADLEQAKHAHYGPTNTAELYEDEKKINVVRAEKNLKLFLNTRVNGVEQGPGKRITAVISQDIVTGRRLRLKGRWFVDSTGDACVGFMAGADYEMTIPGHMGTCNLWNVKDTGSPVEFAKCPWALDLSDKPFPGRSKVRPDTLKLGGWYWESGFDHDPFEKGEYIRDWNFRAMYGAWDALKNVDKVFPNHKLNWAAYVCGKRESRRLMGDIVLSKDDLLNSVQYDDGCVPTGWKIDLHLPDKAYVKGFEGDAFISAATFGGYKMPYWIPYRTLYSRTIPNLFMAGRDTSVTHDALGAARVMRTGGLMGEVVAMAATICKKHSVDPRDVYQKHLAELKALMAKGAGTRPASAVGGVSKNPPATKPAKIVAPEWLKGDMTNLAKSAKLTASASRDGVKNPASLLNDGKADLSEANGRWLGEGALPHWVEMSWDQPQTISALRVLSGYPQGDGIIGTLEEFVLQVDQGGEWKDVAGSAVKENKAGDAHVRFAPVQASKVRLLITGTYKGVSRVWEVELYNVLGEAR